MALSRFLEDVWRPSNGAGKALRGIAVGRWNGLSAGSGAGGHLAAAVATAAVVRLPEPGRNVFVNLSYRY